MAFEQDTSRLMLENEFWRLLECRVSRKLSASPDLHLRWLASDGFTAEIFDFDSKPPHIRGIAWVLGRGSDNWKLTFVLNAGVRSIDEIDWAALLPPDDTHGWLAVDLDKRQVIITPSDARTDV